MLDNSRTPFSLSSPLLPGLILTFLSSNDRVLQDIFGDCIPAFLGFNKALLCCLFCMFYPALTKLHFSVKISRLTNENKVISDRLDISWTPSSCGIFSTHYSSHPGNQNNEGLLAVTTAAILANLNRDELLTLTRVAILEI